MRPEGLEEGGDLGGVPFGAEAREERGLLEEEKGEGGRISSGRMTAEVRKTKKRTLVSRERAKPNGRTGKVAGPVPGRPCLIGKGASDENRVPASGGGDAKKAPPPLLSPPTCKFKKKHARQEGSQGKPPPPPPSSPWPGG